MAALPTTSTDDSPPGIPSQDVDFHHSLRNGESGSDSNCYGVTENATLVRWNPIVKVWTTVEGKIVPKEEVCKLVGEPDKGPQPRTIEELREVYMRWLAIDEDIDALDVTQAALLDRQIPGDPLWLFVVGPSGSTKTELLRSLYNLPEAFHLSSLTSKTIVSGKERRDGTVVRGLFSKMDEKVVVIPELSQILSKSREERDAIFAQLRDLYDGHCVYGYGTIDEPITVNCRIGLICGVTSAIDMYGSVHAVLGERFLKIRPKFNRDLARERALANKDILDKMRTELATAAKSYFRHLQTHKIPAIRPEKLSKIGLYAEFVANLRTTVTSQAFREYDTSEWQPEPEFATRLSQQLLKLAQSLAVLRGHGEVTEEDLKTVSRVASDTCLPNRLAIVRALYHSETSLNITDIAEKAGLPYRKAWNSIESLTVIGSIIEEIGSDRQHNERKYQLTGKFRRLMDRMLGAIKEDSIMTSYPFVTK